MPPSRSGFSGKDFATVAAIALLAAVVVFVGLPEVQHGPRHRLLNLDAIANVNIFALQPMPDGAFYVPKVWLQ